MSGQTEFRHPGTCDICEKSVVFSASNAWLRDHFLCPVCMSIPRERALMSALKLHVPDYARKAIHESSPIGRGVSERLAREARRYSISQYIPGVAFGSHDARFNARCESLEALTFADNSFDLIITQDVMEHVMSPDVAFREIARVLKPGGAHIFTVPLVRKSEPTRRRAQLKPDGTIEHLLPPEYHGNPVDGAGSLVTIDWGYDILKNIFDASGMPGQIILIDDLNRGIRAEFIEVVICFKR
jgi:SAM-dependent methyltransferase